MLKFKKQVTKKIPALQGKKANEFFISAYSDYLSARLLLLNGHLVQGCILANTSIEKYFKAIKVILNEPIPKHHDITVRKFKNTLKNKFKSIHDIINFEFLVFLAKVYPLRYLEDILEDYSITIIRYKTLAELDQIVYHIEETFKIDVNNTGKFERKYQTDMQTKNIYLTKLNYILNGKLKKQIIEQNDLVYEMRRIPHSGIFELIYQTSEIIDDGKFLYEAFKPETSYPASQFKLCFKPLKK